MESSLKTLVIIILTDYMQKENLKISTCYDALDKKTALLEDI